MLSVIAAPPRMHNRTAHACMNDGGEILSMHALQVVLSTVVIVKQEYTYVTMKAAAICAALAFVIVLPHGIMHASTCCDRQTFQGAHALGCRCSPQTCQGQACQLLFHFRLCPIQDTWCIVEPTCGCTLFTYEPATVLLLVVSVAVKAMGFDAVSASLMTMLLIADLHARNQKGQTVHAAMMVLMVSSTKSTQSAPHSMVLGQFTTLKACKRTELFIAHITLASTVGPRASRFDSDRMALDCKGPSR